MRHPKATFQLKACGVRHPGELRAKPDEISGVVLELHRDDCKGCPLVMLQLDEAKALMRTLQAAVDEAHRRAKEAHRLTAASERSYDAQRES